MIYVPINDLQINKANPRVVRNEGFKKLKESLQGAKGKEMFEARPCIVSNRTGENIIIAGNTRYKAAKELKWQEVPTVIMEGLTEEQEQEIIIRDNVTNGEWDFELLANEWDAVKLEEWGLELPEITELETGEAVEDDYEMPDEVKTDIVLGDLFTIGEHRLLCGDATQVEQVEKLMNNQKADMVFTDPPYGMFLDTKMSERSTVKGNWKSKPKVYDQVIGDHDDFTPDLINTIFASFPDTKEVFIWGADYFAELLLDKNDGSWVVWDKRAGVETMQWSTSEFELCWSKSKHHRKIARITWSGILGTEQEHDHASGRKHPTQKPVKLAAWFFNNWGEEHDIVADIYLGSGSTMIAAHQLKRRCYGMELDPKYCQVIIDRMKKLDPSLVITRNGEPYATT